MGMKPPFVSRRVLKGLRLVVAVALVAGLAAIVLFLRKHDDFGEPRFVHDESLTIEKTTPDGHEYTVNNSLASFTLDVARRDRHSAKIFPDYRSALEYCEAEGLPSLPSVQLIHGKCKEFNDDLVAALELAMQRGISAAGVTGKADALVRLLDLLLAERSRQPDPAIRRHLDDAAVHVAAALELGGTNIALDDNDLAAAVISQTELFLSRPIESRPIGFWSASEELRRAFTRDRFLMSGFSIENRPGACVVLAATISRDPELAETFQRIRDFHAKLTNPPRHFWQTEAMTRPATAVSASELFNHLPAGANLADLLEAGRLEALRKGLVESFGPEAGFALVSYSTSKEIDLLLRWTETGRPLVENDALGRIIEAIETGALHLEPNPDSGWYDYQWYALETLVLHERARESPKLILSKAYEKRLKNAFKSMLAKDRETHIKQLPGGIISGLSTIEEEEEPPPELKIGPEFSAEPTATVYLRTARGYRFLRTALASVLGENALGTLPGISRDGTGDLDESLDTMGLLLYGLYDRVSTELGQAPQYLRNEMSPEQVEEARLIASDWLGSLSRDTHLARDTRVTVPFSVDLNGVRYWATGGIRLEPVRYAYKEKPDVSGVIPVFVPTRYYAPTDIALEFARALSSPLTREEFRAMCDGCKDEAALRRLLGARPRLAFSRELLTGIIGALALICGICLLARRAKTEPEVIRKFKWRLAAVAAVILTAWLAFFLASPSYRLKFTIRHIASQHVVFATIIQNKWFRDYMYGSDPAPDYMIPALIDLIEDPDPQVRYLAATFLVYVWHPPDEAPPALDPNAARFVEILRKATGDPVPEVAGYAIAFLGMFPSKENVDLLLEKLRFLRDNEFMGFWILRALSEIHNGKRDERVLEAILLHTDEAAPLLRRHAIDELGRIDDPRAVNRIAELIAGPGETTSAAALSALQSIRYRTDESEATAMAERFDPILLEAAQNLSFSGFHRAELANEIVGTEAKRIAYGSLLLHPTGDDSGKIERCLLNGVYGLGELGSDAATAVPALRRILAEPSAGEEVRKEVREALEKIDLQND